jgi:cytochrome c peroxidase
MPGNHASRRFSLSSAALIAVSVSSSFVAAGAVAEAHERRLAARSSVQASPIDHPGDQELKLRFARPVTVPVPLGGSQSAERVQLGRVLFFDPRLSGSSFISCATCHNPGLAWGDGLPKAIGHGMKVLGRRTPTILNTGWAPALFWDGRAESLEEQALGPIGAPGEMNMPLPELLNKLDGIAGYKPLFSAAFGDAAISKERIATSIAAFERTVVSAQAPFDRWLGGDETAISAEAKSGFQLFSGKAGCAKCHSGWRFTDDSFHDIGAAGTDLGRGVLFPDLDSMRFAFKTPTLRNVNRRAPYMHDGSEATLAAVIDLYDVGGRVKRPSLAFEVHPLHLDASEKRDLQAFLETLTSFDPPVAVPNLPR